MNEMNLINTVELTENYEERLAALKEEMSAADKYIQQDNNDLTELENRYDRLDIPYPLRRFLDDYIACLQTKYERLADLCYLAGEKGLLLTK